MRLMLGPDAELFVLGNEGNKRLNVAVDCQPHLQILPLLPHL